ncbi:hypothetical protein BD413DRAFT_555316 [Trametes elegans]|nr:hypothetical protein BD413DRAFT_555316 [Trametes elegans]
MERSRLLPCCATTYKARHASPKPLTTNPMSMRTRDFCASGAISNLQVCLTESVDDTSQLPEIFICT